MLIHLCEKDVVVPDIIGARGRGSSRLFSRRNLFEFLVALTLRRYEIPVKVIGLVTRLLREFEGAVKAAEPNAKEVEFVFPDFLLTKGSPKLELHYIDGQQLVMALCAAGASRFFLIDVEPFLAGNSGDVSMKRLTELPDTYQTRLSVNLTELARVISPSIEV